MLIAKIAEARAAKVNNINGRSNGVLLIFTAPFRTDLTPKRTSETITTTANMNCFGRVYGSVFIVEIITGNKSKNKP